MKKKEFSQLFAVIGLGRFGTALAISLCEAGKEVIVVDSYEHKVRELRQYTEHAFVCTELNKEALEEMGIQNCDTVIVCIGEKIDTSILTTLNVVNLGVPNVIAKALSKDQGAVLEKIGARVVYPERDMALRLGRQLASNQYLDYFMLANDMEISQIKVTEALIGKSIVDIGLRQRFGVTMIAVEHENQTDTEVEPGYRFRKGDILIVFGKREKIGIFEAFIGESS